VSGVFAISFFGAEQFYCLLPWRPANTLVFTGKSGKQISPHLYAALAISLHID